MNKISINLLPGEILIERAYSKKFALINNISIGVLVIIIIITTAVLLLKISQNKEIEMINGQVKMAEDEVLAERGKEETIFALKNRLNSILVLKSGNEIATSIFNLIISLIPPEIQLIEATVNKNGVMTASFNSSSLVAVNTFFNNLSNKEKNSNVISKVDLDGISLGKDLSYRFALKISTVNK